MIGNLPVSSSHQDSGTLYRLSRLKNLWIAAMTGMIVLAAVTPRLMARDVYVTLDEDNWLKRTAGFAYALSSGELRRTYQNGHPGVTTMWLGMIGMGQEQALQFATKVRGQGLIGR